jgi:hypothetical protein
VLLQASAPTEAIVCAPGLMNDRYAEQEYVVDRLRQLPEIEPQQEVIFAGPGTRPPIAPGRGWARMIARLATRPRSQPACAGSSPRGRSAAAGPPPRDISISRGATAAA